MQDIEDTHAEKAGELIRNFHAQASEILTGSAKAFAGAIETLNRVHAEFCADLGALGAATEAQVNSRIATTRELHKELLHHFTGTVSVRDPVITITAPAMPQTADGPDIDGMPPEEPFPAVVRRGPDARANGAP